MEDLRPTTNIRALIDKLSRQTSKLQRMAVTIGTGRDNADFRDRLNEEKDRGMNLIHDIVRHIKSVGPDHPSMRGYASRFEQEARAFQDAVDKIRIRRDSDIKQKNSESIGQEEDDLQVGLLEAQVDGQLNALEAKRTQIRNLEQDVTELATMFQDLHGLVHDQQSVVDQIEVHVEEAKQYTENASSELAAAERYQRGARRRQLCCCLVLLFMIGIIVLVIYLLVKK
eukprot:CAMPEP_0167785848 /NCGR_PEP_ID=MMETSP0111_2-20121227/8451_1 /TAXON_ID=91324 /ORGANISM="Lotharella globosa, Strain CCCM811" /LENGTH=226 /DNA_ID=CAMNT_0007677137 /DNA_START=166 /DNA_END=846 /DNA_ORIENTATION=+